MLNIVYHAVSFQRVCLEIYGKSEQFAINVVELGWNHRVTLHYITLELFRVA